MTTRMIHKVDSCKRATSLPRVSAVRVAIKNRRLLTLFQHGGISLVHLVNRSVPLDSSPRTLAPKEHSHPHHEQQDTAQRSWRVGRIGQDYRLHPPPEVAVQSARCLYSRGPRSLLCG